MEVASETAMHLVDKRLVRTEKGMAAAIAQVAAALEIPVPTLRDAWRRLDEQGYVAPKNDPTEVRTHAPAPPPAEPSRPTARGTKIRDGKRWCPGCKQRLAVDAFDFKNDAGHLRSRCRPCWKAYQRNRYLSTKRLSELGKLGLTFTITEADGTGLTCAGCGEPLRPGDVVQGETSVCHARPGCFTPSTADDERAMAEEAVAAIVAAAQRDVEVAS